MIGSCPQDQVALFENHSYSVGIIDTQIIVNYLGSNIESLIVYKWLLLVTWKHIGAYKKIYH